MTSKPRKDEKRDRQIHIYMTKSDHAALEKWATEECRSVNGQVLQILRKAIEARPAQ